MSVEDQILYHQSRAMRELDQGRAARSGAAARAHLELSSLHMARLLDLQRHDGSLMQHALQD